MKVSAFAPLGRFSLRAAKRSQCPTMVGAGRHRAPSIPTLRCPCEGSVNRTSFGAGGADVRYVRNTQRHVRLSGVSQRRHGEAAALPALPRRPGGFARDGVF